MLSGRIDVTLHGDREASIAGVIDAAPNVLGRKTFLSREKRRYSRGTSSRMV